MKPTLALALVLVLSACQDRAASSSLAERAAGLQARMNTDTLMVDGKPVPVAFHEFKGGPTFPAQFAVRYPEGMAVTAERSAMGEVVQLTQSADSTVGMWRLTFLPEGTAEDAARDVAMGVAGALGADTADPSAPVLSQSGAASRVWLTRHAGRYILVQSSAGDAAAWDAFAPRAAFVDSHWTWADDGSTLAG